MTSVSHKSKVHIFQLMNTHTFLQDIRPRLDKMDFENYLLLRGLLWVLFSKRLAVNIQTSLSAMADTLILPSFLLLSF